MQRERQEFQQYAIEVMIGSGGEVGSQKGNQGLEQYVNEVMIGSGGELGLPEGKGK